MDMIKVKINGKEYSVAKGSTVLEAAKAAHIDIPTPYMHGSSPADVHP